MDRVRASGGIVNDVGKVSKSVEIYVGKVSKSVEMYVGKVSSIVMFLKDDPLTFPDISVEKFRL